MEPLFRNIDVKTEKKNREICRNVFPSYHIFYTIMFFIALVYNIYWMWYDFSINLILAGFLIFVIAAYLTRPYAYAKKRIKNYSSLYNAPETDEVLFFENCFIDKDIYSKAETKIEYERISSVKTTRNYYIFSIKNSRSKFAINKEIENLTVNTDFVSFINNKMINSKRRIK